MENKSEAFTEEESLKTMTQMLERVKDNQYENGAVPILWGVVIAVCNLVKAAELFWKITIGFNIFWLTVLAALIHAWTVKSIRAKQVVLTHEEQSIKIIWMLFFFSLAGLLLYYEIVLDESAFQSQSPLSLHLLLYFMPTLFTGIIARFKPMTIGGIICLALFVVSLFSNSVFDMLLLACAAVVCWLLPGFILRKQYYDKRKKGHA